MRSFGPNFAIEVLAPSAAVNGVMMRVVEQFDLGRKLVWIIDPETETVAVYRAGKQPYVLKTGDELTGEDVLPDFRCKVAEFFQLPGQ